MSRLTYLTSGVVLICVLAALLWAAKTHEETVQSLPDILARDIQPLLQGEQVTDIHTGRIEERVQDLKSKYPYVEEIIIKKLGADGREYTLYPWAYEIDHPDHAPRDDDAFMARSLINDENEIQGYLFIKINAKRGQLFRMAIVGSILALILVTGLGLYTIRSKDEAVRKTVLMLEEKQRELIRLERMALVGQLTANLLHDLKKPVLNIRAEAEQISEDELRRSLLDETDLFLGMVRDLRLESFLRADQEKAEFLDVGELIERSLRLVKYARDNVEVKRDIPGDLPFLFGQRHQLIQVFSNILLNAFQALQGTGTMRISAAHLVDEDEKWVEISFTDDGPGMPYEVLAHVFDPFYSTHGEEDSTGLGLYITKTIVESMGGQVWARSIPKHGTTFTLRFPVSEEEAGTD